MQTLRQISVGELKRFATYYSTNQKYRCGICGDALKIGDTALDHCHDTGHLRGTLCRTCNTGEGKVKHGCRYMAKVTHLSKVDYLQWLKNLVRYLEHAKEHPSGFIHPSFDLVKGKQKPKKRPKRRK